MSSTLAREIAALGRLSTSQLQARYAEVFGEETHANHKTWLIKRIAWRLQAVALGELSERARRRALEVANDADLRLNPPLPSRGVHGPKGSYGRTKSPSLQAASDSRLPQPGAILTRIYKGKQLEVTRSEEHTSELQSLRHLVCRLLLEKKKVIYML